MSVRAHSFPDRLRRGLCILGVLLPLVLPSSLQAQQVSVTFAQGTHLFRRILFDLHLEPLQDLRQLQNEPQNKLLIVLGEAEFLRWRGLNLAAFVQQGGAVLLATDRRCESVIAPFGVSIYGAPVTVDLPSKAAYKQREDCIFVRSQAKDVPLFEDLSLEENLSRVATNRPGYLTSGGSLRVLATFPRGCSAGGVGRFAILPFAAGGRFGQGRILILSDHSVFINAMMWQPDLDNFDFAYNCVNWLTEKGQRKQVLFLEEGQVQRTFEIPLKEPPPPPLPSLKAVVETVDHGIGALEKDDVLNGMIHKGVRQLTSPSERWVQSVILMATLGLGMFGLARLTQARQRREKAAQLAATSPVSAPSAPTLFDERQQSMLHNGNVWEAARALARQAFESTSVPPSPGNQRPPNGAAAALPSFRLPGSRWRTWRLRRRINYLWQLAYGAEPIRVSARQLRRLGPEIEKLKALLTRLVPPTGPRP